MRRVTRAADKPLPGDLVIRDDVDGSGVRPPAFLVSHWPRTDACAGPYQSYGYALRTAREFALKDGARVWRVVNLANGRLHDVTED
jgi:hypothetical protein